MNGIFVDQPDALAPLCDRLRASTWLAVDSEFMRESTYYAQLCLIQIATPTVIACVDPIALDISPLLDLVYDPQRVKIFHSARQDLEVLADLRSTPPENVFDTQIAAAYLGYSDQIGYGTLVETICGVKLAKTHTRTNWARRPLSSAQLQYAEDDVRYLGALHERLSTELDRAGRGHWPAQDFAALSDPALYRCDPSDAWRRIKNGHLLEFAGQVRLRELSIWRERRAREDNLPRSWVLRDPLMFDLARGAPRTRDELRRFGEMTEQQFLRYGADILAVIESAARMPSIEIWKPPTILTRAQADRCKRIMDGLRKCATDNRISPSVLATRREVERLVLGDGKVGLLQGWRRELIDDSLLELVSSASAA